MDIKHIARVLYNNRDNKDYLTDEGKRRILAANGAKVAKRTYQFNKKSIDKELDRLFDKDFDNKSNQPSNEELEKLISKHDYINMLKRIMDGEPDGKKTPMFKDRLQAGKQAAEFFGWNAPEKISHTDIEGKAIEIKGNTAIFKIDLNAAI